MQCTQPSRACSVCMTVSTGVLSGLLTRWRERHKGELSGELVGVPVAVWDRWSDPDPIEACKPNFGQSHSNAESTPISTKHRAPCC